MVPIFCLTPAKSKTIPWTVHILPKYPFWSLGSLLDFLIASWHLGRIIFLPGTTCYLCGYDRYSPDCNPLSRLTDSRTPAICSCPESERKDYHHVPHETGGRERMAFLITSAGAMDVPTEKMPASSSYHTQKSIPHVLKMCF